MNGPSDVTFLFSIHSRTSIFKAPLNGMSRARIDQRDI